MISEQFGQISEGFNIPYGEDTHKRTGKQFLRKVKNTILASIAYSSHSRGLRIKCHKWRGVHVGENVYIGIHCTLDNLYPELIYLEDHAAVNANSVILTHFNPYKAYSRVVRAQAAPVLIKRYSLIAVGSIVMPGVCINEFSMVSAGSVVYHDVEARTVVRGNPAVKIGRFPRSIGQI